MKTFLFIALAIATTASAEKISIALNSGGSMTGLLVAKSDTGLKIETRYGIITLPPNAVTPESWTAAQRASPSKPTGKYIVPNPSPKPPQPGKKIVKGPTQSKSPYKAGFSDGRIVGKHDCASGKDRDGEKAQRLGKLHAQSYSTSGDQDAYAKGYYEGYNEGWHQRHAYEKLKS